MTPLLQPLIETLREELQQYGEMLALLDQQHEQVRRQGVEAVQHCHSSIHTQSGTIQGARARREAAQRHLAQALGQPTEATFSRLIPVLPEPYGLLVNALVQENNELLVRVRQRAEQNQLLLQRSLDLMQQFLTTLAPADPAPAPIPNVLDAVGPDSACYAAIL